MIIGTDCGGIEAPIQALKELKIPFKHMFSSEIDKFSRESIRANYDPLVLYEDMTVYRNLPLIDIYVCGFPCQPFSMAGKRLLDSRSNIFIHCLRAVEQTKPSLFILENVTGITTIQGGEYFNFIKKKLGELEDYIVEYLVLNTKDYGIPQNRKRLFIVGLKKDKIKRNLGIPDVINCRDINEFIDYDCTRKDEYSPSKINKYEKFKDAIFVNIDMLRSTSSKANNLYSSTLMASSLLWCIPMHRKATIKEYLSLQGFPIDFKQVVSDTQLKKQIGNSMSVNVLVALFRECFDCLGW